MFRISLGEQRGDVPDTQTLPDCLRVITTVPQHAIRMIARSSSLSLQGLDSINERKRLLRIVTIRAGELDGKWYTATVADQMTFAAQLGPVGGIRSRLQPPKTARIELPSTTARDQSISPQRASQSSKEKWISCQMPPSCQSRRRRQQVMPEPQPNSWGRYSQGMPVTNTNRMPVKASRLPTGGRPPFGEGVCLGKRGSRRTQS